MDLKYNPEEEKFRAEVRAFFDAELPTDIRTKLQLGRHIAKDDMVRWQKILYAQGLGRAQLADALRRHRLERRAAAYIRGRARRPPARRRRTPFRLKMLAPVMQTFGNAAQQEYFLPRILSRRGLVVPGILRTGFRLRPRLAADQRGAPGRSLHRQRSEDLEHPGPVRGLDLLPGAHQHRGASAAGHFVSADRHEIAGHHACGPIIMLDGGHEINDIFFDNVKVPVQNLIGEENKGWTYAKFLLTPRAHRQCRHRHVQAGAEETQGDRRRADRRTAARSSRIRAFATASPRSKWS